MNAAERQTVSRGIDLLQRAIRHDRRNARALALAHYCRGLDLLLSVLRSPRCTGRIRDVIQQKCQQYLDRAQLLRNAIHANGPMADQEPDVDDDEEAGDEPLEEDVDEPIEGEAQGDEGGEERDEAGGDGQLANLPGAGIEDPSTGTRKARILLDQLECNYDRERRQLQWYLDVCLCREKFDNVQPTLMGSSADLRAVEDKLREMLLLPLRFPHLVQARLLSGRRTLLLYGHKGTGKTQMLREFLTSDVSCEFLRVSALNLLYTAVASEMDMEKLIRGVLERAKEAAPCVLCLEDFEVFGCSQDLQEVLGGPRGVGEEDAKRMEEPFETPVRRMKTELLVGLEQILRCEKPVIVAATTSRPWLLCASLRRRFGVRCFFPMPTPEERVAILMRCLEGVPHVLGHDDLREIGNMTVRFSRGDMAMLADEVQVQMKARLLRSSHFKRVVVTSDEASASIDNDSHSDTDMDVVSEPGACACQSSDARDGHCDGAAAEGIEGPEDAERNEDCELPPEQQGPRGARDRDEDSAQSGTTGSDANADLRTLTQTHQGCESEDTCSNYSKRTSDSVNDHRESERVKYAPCDARDSDVIQMTWRDYGMERLLEPPVAMCDVVQALTYMSARVTDEDVSRMIQWSDDFA